MPTNPTPQLPRNTSPVGTKTKRINFQNADKTELETFQRNIADRMDEVLTFVNGSFMQSAASKATGTTAVQLGSSQKATNAPASSVSFRGQPTKTCVAPLAQGFAAANTLGSTTVWLMTYKPAGSTVAPTQDPTIVCPPFAGTIVGAELTQYIAAATAGTYSLVVKNVTQNSRVTTLIANRSYAKQYYAAATTPVSFNAQDVLLFNLTTVGWVQNAAGGVEVKFWAQTS